jgi:hypothetical protein
MLEAIKRTTDFISHLITSSYNFFFFIQGIKKEELYKFKRFIGRVEGLVVTHK